MFWLEITYTETRPGIIIIIIMFAVHLDGEMIHALASRRLKRGLRE